MSAPLHTSSFQTLSIRVTITKLIKYFLTRPFTILISALLTPHASAHFSHLMPLPHATPLVQLIQTLIAFMPDPLLLSTLSYIRCHLGLQVLNIKEYTSSNGSPFSLHIHQTHIYISRAPNNVILTHIDLQCSSFIVYQNLLNRLHNFSKAATSAVSSANNSCCISNLPLFAPFNKLPSIQLSYHIIKIQYTLSNHCFNPTLPGNHSHTSISTQTHTPYYP